MIFRFQLLYRHSQLQVTDDLQSGLPRQAVCEPVFHGLPTPGCSEHHAEPSEGTPGWGDAVKPAQGPRRFPHLGQVPTWCPWPRHHAAPLCAFPCGDDETRLTSHPDAGRLPIERDGGRHHTPHSTAHLARASFLLPFGSCTETICGSQNAALLPAQFRDFQCTCGVVHHHHHQR